MSTNRLFYLLIVIFLVVTACAPQTLDQGKPITLRLAIADAEGRPSDPYVREFIEQVKSLSDGNITIEPVWEAAGNWGAGDPINAYFEFGVIQLVREGKFELGLGGSRAFDIHGITSFQALQAPFLIDNEALSKVVATSDIATRMLDDLSSSGMIGVTLWPEDLRHPFSLIPDQPILSPEDFAGLNVRAIPSDVTYALIETFGGNARLSGSDYQVFEAGLRQGASLTGTPTATGNVVFFPKFQVLFANGTAFEKLSENQRSVLRNAAAATQQKAIAEHPSEVDAGTAWCADGGSIVLVSEEKVAAFEAAAQPVFATLEKNPLNAELIAAIRKLKAKTEPSAGATACAPDLTHSTPESIEVWSEGLPPNGVWQVELTTEDIAQMGVLRSKAVTWAGVFTWTFQDGKAQNQYRGTAGTDYSCQADLTFVEDVVRVTYTSGSDCKDEVDDLQWRLDDDGLHLHLAAIRNAPYLENKAYLEAKPWQKVEVWSVGLPPNGVWQVELTSDDFLRMGLIRSAAAEWVGVYTIKYQDGRAIEDFQGPVRTTHCEADLEVIGDVVRETYTSSNPPRVCTDPPVILEFQWRLDDDGLHLQLVSMSEQGAFLENAAVLEAKPWQKVE